MKKLITSLALTGLLAALTACSGADDTDQTADSGPVTLKVARDPGLDKGAVAAFDERVAQFEKANPDIDVVPQEYNWTATTFTAQLAGNTLPDVFTVPFTDGRGLIERKQIADISGLVSALPYAGKFSATVTKAGQADDGKMWAVPIAAYGQALHYNRTLFKQAGLDPDKPPATWDELRSAAKQIADTTGKAGYAQLTADNTGGWILTTLDYAFGGRAEKLDGDKATAELDTPQMTEVLRLLKSMRWDDNSMGSNFLYDWGSINQAFAAGQIGMYVSGGGNYGSLVTQNALKPADYGVTVVPLKDSPDAGVLGGGTLATVSAKASEPVKAAAVKWIDFYYLKKLVDQQSAVLDAKTIAASKQPVGVPQLPVFDKATYDKSLKWVAQYVNVPLAQMTPYTDKMFDQPLVTEPSRSTQEVYKILDPVVQSVLTQKDADIADLLKKADAEAQALLDRN
ncbi:extracellular solute-binding protein family 1 [Kribbella flavida DSM 17836]|uniref:Extracellular solute-binding protein family 1 n=1 Tax=Kribbella flavida (strain DSM 17836 / JCM 10339 / NBRC 14399) TaxID=479435 RepID=D2PZ84_KRIFD|nr:extracellular solute-binding protein [Kribbella flavida]ADB33693.1 extracellular solute-binding protein family 1 [Kribbella flavida DSM 17836]